MFIKIVFYFFILIGVFLIGVAIISFFMNNEPIKTLIIKSLVGLIPVSIGFVLKSLYQLTKK